MNKRFTIAMIVLVVVAVGAFYTFRPKHANQAPVVEAIEPEVNQEALAAPIGAPADVSGNVETPAPPRPAAGTLGVVDSPEVTKARQEKFQAALKAVEPCLGMIAESHEALEPTYENLTNALSSETGDPVVRNEDWSNTMIQLPNGEQRRIRVEMDYAGEEFIRKLKYDTIKADGSIEAIPLNAEQSENPTDTFIAGLESDGKPTLREKRARVYYPNGTELILQEKNGLISTMELSMVEGKKLKCTSLETATGSCNCQ